jgi:hypothetical protein
MTETNRRTTLYLTKENARILGYLSEKYGENINQTFMRALNTLYQKECLNDAIVLRETLKV